MDVSLLKEIADFYVESCNGCLVETSMDCIVTAGSCALTSIRVNMTRDVLSDFFLC